VCLDVKFANSEEVVFGHPFLLKPAAETPQMGMARGPCTTARFKNPLLLLYFLSCLVTEV